MVDCSKFQFVGLTPTEKLNIYHHISRCRNTPFPQRLFSFSPAPEAKPGVLDKAGLFENPL